MCSIIKGSAEKMINCFTFTERRVWNYMTHISVYIVNRPIIVWLISIWTSFIYIVNFFLSKDTSISTHLLSGIIWSCHNSIINMSKHDSSSGSISISNQSPCWDLGVKCLTWYSDCVMFHDRPLVYAVWLMVGRCGFKSGLLSFYQDIET